MNKRKRKRLEKAMTALTLRNCRLAELARDRMGDSGAQRRLQALRVQQAETAFQERHGLVEISPPVSKKSRRRQARRNKQSWLRHDMGTEWRFVQGADTQAHAGMVYEDYLKTPYWLAVRQIKLHEANYQCQVCSTRQNLQVHHLSYEFRGREHLAFHQLQVLCRDCHMHAHGLTEAARH